MSRYRLWVGFHGRDGAAPHAKPVRKEHLGKRVNHPIFGKVYTALCDTREKIWYGEDAGPILVRQLAEEHSNTICRRCIQLAGLSEKVKVVEMPITIDWSQSEGSDYSPVEPGEYEAVITGVKMSDKAGPSGYHYIEIEFQGQEPKRKYWSNYSLSPKALWRLRQVLVALGIEVEDGPMELEPEEIIGKDCLLEITIESYNGKETNRVGEVKASTGSYSW